MESNLDLNSLQKEVLVSSDTSGQFWNVCVWDYNSGSSLQTFKNSSAVPHGLEFVKADYLLLAAYNKPYIVCWNLKGKSQSTKINTSGCVSCMASTQCGNYLAIAIEEKIFILHLYSGRILSVLTRHLLHVKCLKFSSNDKYLITAGDDTSILVWDFNQVLTTEREYLKPHLVWSSHSMKTNDLYVSPISDRVVSISADQSCKFWNLANEIPFPTQNLLFQSTPICCLFDHLETNLYVGLANGGLLAISIKTILHESDKLITDAMDNKSFLGHKQKVNCLAISLDDFTLASGSSDCDIRIWDTQSRQCIKVINQNAEVTNLEFKLRTVFFNDEPNITPPLFTRYTIDTNQTGHESLITKKQTNQLELEDFLNGGSLSADNIQDEYFELKSNYENLKKINNKMYNYALDKILDQN